jgi:Tfp pilus assembly protein PilF
MSRRLISVECAAWAGHVEVMANYGASLYQRGESAEAVPYWKRAWKAGNASAGFNLGTHYSTMGETDRAEVIWQRSAELGDVDAMVRLVRLALERATARPALSGFLRCSNPQSRSR